MPESKEASSDPWRRHDLVRVAPDAWASALADCPSAAETPLLRTWADKGWPAIIRRRAEREDPRLAPVGVPLPPAAGKRRVALLIPPDGVLGRSRPPLLRAAASVANSSWRSTIASILDLGERIGTEPSVFGGLMWQHQTGLTYLSPRSDLDLLWPIPRGFDVLSLVSGLAKIQSDAPMRIDGEIIFPDGGAVHWQELRNARQTGHEAGVLAKTMEGVRLFDAASLPGMGRLA